MKNVLLILCVLYNLQVIGQNQVSDFIHVDQFGYTTTGNKVAVLSNPTVGYNSNLSYTPSAVLELRDFTSNQIVFSAAPQVWNNDSIHAQSGDKGWWFDFSSFNTEGSYYVYDPINNESSAVFEIEENPYKIVLQTATKMFYYNRCNFEKAAPYAGSNWIDSSNFDHALQDYNCRYIFDPTNAALEKDLHGGWFDAGDYNKYVTFSHKAVHELLNAYTDNPLVFGDDWNIPESGNGIPDILDEVIWELDWLLRMTNADGSVHLKMGSDDYDVNISAPPSANTDQRFYGPTCTSASIAAASMFARAAVIFEDIPSLQNYALTLKQNSEQCFAYFQTQFYNNNLEYFCDNFEIISGDADFKSYEDYMNTSLIAAAYLFKLTGDEDYNNWIFYFYDIHNPVAGNYWDPEKTDLNEALLYYTTLSGANTYAVSDILSSVNYAVSNDYNDFYNFSPNDLYRAEMPDYLYYWGSNRAKAGVGVLALQMKKYGIGNAAALEEKAYEQLHYFHGVNPLGLVQLSNMYAFGGEKCVNEIYHTWFNDGTIYDNALSSPNGPAPGFLTGGANNIDIGTFMSPPFGQPAQKSYLDFNAAADSSWKYTEPGIYYQAVYLRLLSNFVDEGNQPADVALIQNDILLFPNPTPGYFTIIGELSNFSIEVLNVTGQTIQIIPNSSNEEVIDLSTLANGLFFIKIQNNLNSDVILKKIIKE